MPWHDLPSYETAVQFMERRRRELLRSGDKRAFELILCEHEPVITCGRRTKAEHIRIGSDERSQLGVALVRSDRGGDVTYHGPGQLMVYPVVYVGIRVRSFVETMTAALAKVAQAYGVRDAKWNESLPGLWVRGRKLMACGLHISEGVSTHGFAFNVSTPHHVWDWIVPCGLSTARPVSLAELSGEGCIDSVADVARIAEPILLGALASFVASNR